MEDDTKNTLSHINRDPLIRKLNKVVMVSVKLLAILMVLVIWMAMADVIVHLYRQLTSSFTDIFGVENLINTLGNFLVVLIAIEIFLNIIFYLNEDSINVSLVLATALTAIARKVIVVDYKSIEPLQIFGVAAVILATGISYWLVSKKQRL